MDMKIRKLHQTLHGYNLGHNLLASSVRLGGNSMRKMEKMSDFFGNVAAKEQEQFYTGYYLIDEGYYVIACTWHAQEMNRPGCVWTHSLLIKEGTLGYWKQHIVELLSLFRRPKDSMHVDAYENELALQGTEEDSLILVQEKIKYIMWSIWGKNYPVIVNIYCETI